METRIYLTGILPQVCTFYLDHMYTSIKACTAKSMKLYANSTQVSVDIEPLPRRSTKRPRSRTPDSPSLNRSARLKGAISGNTLPCSGKGKHTEDEDLLEFLGDCVEFI